VGNSLQRQFIRGIDPDNYVKLSAQPEVYAEQIEDLNDRAIFLQDVALNPLKWWTPNGEQEKYINAAAEYGYNNEISVVLVTFANGVGKTTATVNILLNTIYGAQNGWFDHEFFTERWTKPKTIWYISTAEAISGTVVPMIEGFLPKDLFPEFDYDMNKEGKSFVSKMSFPSGWELRFKTFDQDEKSFESANVGMILIDEPAPEHIWKACKSRRRMGNISLLPMTPLDCPPYILDEIKDAADRNTGRHAHLTASVYGACKDRGIRGHLDRNTIDQMVEDYDREEREARAYGRFMYFSGMILNGFNESKHVVNPDEWPIHGNYKLFHVVDPHDTRPPASLWAAKFANGRWIIFFETPRDQSRAFWAMKEAKLIEDVCKEWKRAEEAMEHRLKIKVNPVRIMDKRFGWQQRGQTTLAKIYSQNGFHFTKSYTSNTEEGEIDYGHDVIRAALRDMDDGYPGLLIYKTCFHTINGLKHYIRRKKKGKTSEDFATSDGIIVDKYKDFPDIVRYLVASEIMPLQVEVQKSEEEQFIDSIVREDEDDGFDKVGVAL